MKKIISMILVLAMVLSLAACGSSAPAETTAPAAQDEQAPAGKVVNVQIEVEVESLDPQEATDGTSFEVIADYTDGLTQMDADGAAVPAIASSWDVSEDQTVYTFHIREDANWSNGEPVTANDFVFAWQRAVDPAMASEYSYMLSDIGQIKNAYAIIDGEMDKSELGVKALDAKTLEVTLDVPVSYFLSLMYFPTFYPVNEAFFNSLPTGTFGTSPETVLSNGAFILTEYEPAALAFSLEKNPGYYDAAKVKLDGINYQVIKDSQQAYMSYQNGDLDMVKLSGDQIEQVEGDPELSVHGAGYLWYLTLNMHDVPALDNQNMRLALANAIDRVAIVDDVVKDGSLATYTAVPPQFAASATTGADFSADQDMFKDVCNDDAAKAAEYYEKAKAELGADSFKFVLLVEDQTETQNVATVIKEQVEKTLPGVTMSIDVKPKKERVKNIQEGDYEVCLTRWGPDYADPMTYLNMWITGCSNNYGLWSDAEFDRIIADCTTGAYVSDYDARWAAMYEAEKIVMDQAVIIPLYTKANAYMINSDIQGLEFHPVALNTVFKNTSK